MSEDSRPAGVHSESTLPPIVFVPLDRAVLIRHLHLAPPPLRTEHETWFQLDNILEQVSSLGAVSMAVEQHYIDRDYMEDHSIFYAKSLFPYPNSCRRVHFFAGAPAAKIDSELSKLAAMRRAQPDAAASSAAKFSRSFYLGFSVVRPLQGSPIGRTVLRCPPGSACGFKHRTHLRGVELNVTGIPFQQQDVGVSACATSALWSSLRALGSEEPIAAATPAQITNLAVKYHLPLGRGLPQSEGLNVGQMCQAVESLGVSPLLMKAADAENALGLLHSALDSKLAPVLLARRCEPSGDPEAYHAMAAVGYELDDKRTKLLSESNGKVADDAQQLNTLILHDDRIGPYVRAAVAKGHNLRLNIARGPKGPEDWEVRHILVPIHSKIRISFVALRQVAIHVATEIGEWIVRKTDIFPGASDEPISFSTRLVRAHRYIDELLRTTPVPQVSIEQLSTDVKLSRYLGVISVSAEYLGRVDVLIDSTSTSQNLHALGVVLIDAEDSLSPGVATFVSSDLLARSSTPVPLFGLASNIPQGDS